MTPEHPDRRELALALLGALGGAGLMSCAVQSADAETQNELVNSIAQAASGGGELKFADSIAELRKLKGCAGWIAVLTGHLKAGDGGGGVFYWSETVVQDDGGTILNPKAGSSGGWRRLYSGPINSAWFGAGLGRPDRLIFKKDTGLTIGLEPTSGEHGRALVIQGQNTDGPANDQQGHIGGPVVIRSGRGFDSYGIQLYEDTIPIATFSAEGGIAPIMVCAPSGSSSFTFFAPQSSLFQFAGRDLVFIDGLRGSLRAGIHGPGEVHALTWGNKGVRIAADGNAPTERLEVNGNVKIDASAAAPRIFQDDRPAPGELGEPFRIQAQNATGPGTTGGDLTLASGSGTAAPGSIKLEAGGTTTLQIDGKGLGFFASPPVAKPTITGTKGENEALASLIGALAALGLVDDRTT